MTKPPSPHSKIRSAGPAMNSITNIYLHGGESGIRRVEGGRKFPELTERSEVSLGNFQPLEVRPLPHSPNLQVCSIFIPYTL
jgi:hypothetical protein